MPPGEASGTAVVGRGAKRSALPRTVIALGLTSLFTDVGSEMIFPLLPVFLTETLRAGPAFLGLVEGAAEAVASLLKLASGVWADRQRGRGPLVVFGYGLASIARPLVAAATAPWQVLAIRLTDRFGKGVRTSPRDAMIADAVDSTSAGRAFGFHRAMDHAGAVIGPLVAAGLLAGGLSLRGVFWLAAIPGALAVITVTLAVRGTVASGRRAVPGTAAAAAGPAPAAGPWWRLPRPLASYLGILFVFSLGNSSDAFLLLRARDLGLSAALIPILWAALHVSKMASSYVAGAWSDRVPRVRLIIGGWMVYAAVYLGLGLARGPLAAWLLFLVYGTYYGLTEPAEKALVRELMPEGRRGRAFGFYNFVVGASALPAGLITGGLWRAFGPMVALATGAAMAGLAAVLLAAWAITERDARR